MKKFFLALLGVILASAIAIVLLDKKNPDREEDQENSDL